MEETKRMSNGIKENIEPSHDDAGTHRRERSPRIKPRRREVTDLQVPSSRHREVTDSQVPISRPVIHPTNTSSTNNNNNNNNNKNNKNRPNGRKRTISDPAGRIRGNGSSGFDSPDPAAQTTSTRRPDASVASASSNKADQAALAADLAAGVRTYYENTFQIAPKKGDQFRVPQVEGIMRNVLESYLGGEHYDVTRCKQMALQLGDVIRERVKMLKFPRYKFVCLVTIGQNARQSFQLSSRCLWDIDTDASASVSYRNSSLFATANVFAIYLE